MPKQFSPYIKDDSDVEWIEETASEALGTNSQVFRTAIKFLREEKGEEIEDLAQKDDVTALI